MVCICVLQVDLSNKDAEFVSTYHSINPDEAAPAKVPILLDGDVRLVESGVIVGERTVFQWRQGGPDLLRAEIRGEAAGFAAAVLHAPSLCSTGVGKHKSV